MGGTRLMRRAVLAVDVGGSTSRAYLADASGTCLGRGRSHGGNPASNDPKLAAAAIVAAVEAAFADAGGENFEVAVALLGLAGPPAHVQMSTLEAAFRERGLVGEIVIAGDLAAMFASATPATNGYCIVCGTGAGAVRLIDGSIDRVADGAGWLLGDAGSGYWLGQQAARAVTAALDGRGEPTALVNAVLGNLGIPLVDTLAAYNRPTPLRALIDAVYALRPIELARFAPLVIEHRNDPVAARLIAQAEDYLIADFETVFDPALPGPVALGGGVIPHLTGIAPRLHQILKAAGHAPDIRPVLDGSIGAIVLALRAIGVSIDEDMFRSIAASVADQKADSASAS